MKALTICQPYAELIARGDKLIENRTWPTGYRGPLAIHAGKSREWLGDDDEEAALYGVDVRSIPFGAVVALGRLSGCYRLDELPDYLKDHEHANGPFCFHITDVVRLSTPAPARGAQGLWTPDRADFLHWIELARTTHLQPEAT